MNKVLTTANHPAAHWTRHIKALPERFLIRHVRSIAAVAFCLILVSGLCSVGYVLFVVSPPPAQSIGSIPTLHTDYITVIENQAADRQQKFRQGLSLPERTYFEVPDDAL